MVRATRKTLEQRAIGRALVLSRPLLAFGTLVASGCYVEVDTPPSPAAMGTSAGSGGAAGSAGSGGSAPSGGTAGSGGGSGATGSGASGGTGGISISPPPSCTTDPPGLALCDQMVSAQALGYRELYSWTTPEQAAELRAGGRLLVVGQAEAPERGYAFTVIDELAAAGTGPGEALLARLSELFENSRYAWPHPWATRMGWSGESYGGELLRIVLKEEAWIASVRRGAVSVVDLENQPVPLEQALASPERLAAIFFEKDAASGGPECISGSFLYSSGSGGYREFIVGSEAMIEEWSLGTAEIRGRLDADIARLRTFFERVRGRSASSADAGWNARVLCAWEFGGTASEAAVYERSLAIPSDLYAPTPANLAALIETLSGDLFDPNPLVVTPGG